jgi:hypothetical protein
MPGVFSFMKVDLCNRNKILFTKLTDKVPFTSSGGRLAGQVIGRL